MAVRHPSPLCSLRISQTARLGRGMPRPWASLKTGCFSQTAVKPIFSQNPMESRTERRWVKRAPHKAAPTSALPAPRPLTVPIRAMWMPWPAVKNFHGCVRVRKRTDSVWQITWSIAQIVWQPPTTIDTITYMIHAPKRVTTSRGPQPTRQLICSIAQNAWQPPKDHNRHNNLHDPCPKTCDNLPRTTTDTTTYMIHRPKRVATSQGPQ